jgi:fucose 4-O-acetylase-like acetyltransferase
MPASARQHRPDIDRAKGLAILLVVFGHLVANGYPPGNAWYDTAKDIVYSFHMPFFMYLSGTVFAFTGKHRLAMAAWPGFVRGRAARLLVPFLLFGLLIVTGKYLSRFFLYVDDPPHGLFDGVGKLFVNTDRSPALSIWYVYVLFVYSAAMPLLWRLGLCWRGAVALGLVLYALPLGDTLYLDRVGDFFLFFAMGGLVAEYRAAIEPWFTRLLPLWLLLFAASLASEWLPVPSPARLLICGLLAIPALHGLMQTRALAQDRVLLALGGYAFPIYLLNTIVIGLAKAGYMKVAPFAGVYAPFAMTLFFVLAVMVPVALQSLLTRRRPGWVPR